MAVLLIKGVAALLDCSSRPRELPTARRSKLLQQPVGFEIPPCGTAIPACQIEIGRERVQLSFRCATRYEARLVIANSQQRLDRKQHGLPPVQPFYDRRTAAARLRPQGACELASNNPRAR
jgi:hypothetical protein